MTLTIQAEEIWLQALSPLAFICGVAALFQFTGENIAGAVNEGGG
jgi:hypothetical protein